MVWVHPLLPRARRRVPGATRPRRLPRSLRAQWSSSARVLRSLACFGRASRVTFACARVTEGESAEAATRNARQAGFLLRLILLARTHLHYPPARLRPSASAP
jgi:hypothetical protein